MGKINTILILEGEIKALENKIKLLEGENKELKETLKAKDKSLKAKDKSIDSLISSGNLCRKGYKELAEATDKIISGMRSIKFLRPQNKHRDWEKRINNI